MEKTVIFDWDGTVADTEALILQSWIEIGQNHGLGDLRDLCYSCIGTTNLATRKIFCDKFGGNFPYDEYNEEMLFTFNHILQKDGIPLKKGLLKLLEFLKANNCNIAVASSTKIDILEEEAQMAGIRDYFHVIAGGDMVQKSKPEPDIFLNAAEMLQVKPEECYVLEDSLNGMRAAHRAGMKPVMVPDLIPPNDEMFEISLKIFPSLVEVREYFSEIWDVVSEFPK